MCLCWRKRAQISPAVFSIGFTVITVAAVYDRRSNISNRPLKSDVPERLRRLEYRFQRLPIYFVTACTHKRRRLLNNAAVQARLIEFGQTGNDRGAWLGAY